MRFVPVVVILAVVALLRLRRHNRGRDHRHGRARGPSGEHSGPSPVVSAPTGRWGGTLFGDTGLVAGREIRERLRGRVFRVVTALLFAVVAAAVVIPTIHTGKATHYRVGVVPASRSFGPELRSLAKAVALPVTVVGEPGLAQARAALAAGRLDMVVEGTSILVASPVPASDASASARYLRAVSATLGEQGTFARAGLTPQQAAAVARARPLVVEALHPAHKARTASESTALLGVILIFIVLTQYLTWTLMGVMEEKASRVVEVLLATVRPMQLLGGKLLGIGTVALAQAVALVAFALLLAKAVGSSLVRGAAPLVVVASLAWLVLGYVFYSWLYAAAGSLAERQDQVQSLALPLSAPLVLGYIVSLTGASSGSPSLLVKVLAYVPPTAPFAMPTLVGFGAATWWQFLLSAGTSVACTVLVALGAARVYRRAVLRTGGRVRLRELVLAGAGRTPGRPPAPRDSIGGHAP